MAASEPPRLTGAAQAIRWARIGATLAALLLVLEALSQAVVYAYAGKRFESLSPYRWSPYGLVRNNPALTSPGFDIDRNGFRSLDDHDKQKPPGTLRVLLLGGSVLYSGLAGVRLDRYGRISSAQTIAPHLESLLAADPLFAGHRIEVINAAVNFNRIVEVSSAYLGEYLQWQPDLVIVFGSINNFYWFRRAGDFAAGRTTLQTPHPFHLEFERLVNDQSLAAFIERAWRTGAEHSAMLALAAKGAVVLADRLVELAQALAGPAGRRVTTTTTPPETPEETGAYMQLYASYADAMIAAARRAKQDIAFVWEPALLYSTGAKPLSDEERFLLKSLDRTVAKAEQFEASRRAFHALFAGAGVAVVDPTDALVKAPGTVFVDYVHYTPDGNRFMASIVHQQLRERLAAGLKDKK